MVSQPDRRRGRGRKLSPSPVASLALEREVPLFRPESANDPKFAGALAERELDAGVVVAFGQFLPKRIRELPRVGYLINAHASLLPRYRGAAPIARAILAGEKRTGVCVMQIAREMDAGAVGLVREVEIGANEDAATLAGRLSLVAAEAVADALDQVAQGTIHWTEQQHELASEAPKLERQDALLDWRDSSEQLVRRIRAMAPKPGALTELSGEPFRILAAQSLPASFDSQDRLPGTVVRGDDPLLRVATGNGWLVLLRVQRAGAKALDIDAFLRGRELPPGTRLGSNDLPSR